MFAAGRTVSRQTISFLPLGADIALDGICNLPNDQEVEARVAEPESTLVAATRKFHWKPARAWFRSLELGAYETARVKLEAPALDLGCGDGSVASTLMSRGILECSSVWGIDYDASVLTSAQSESVYSGLARGDVRQLPFRDAAFQSIVTNGVLGGVADAEKGCREVARVLRPGGMFAATVPTDRFIDTLLWPRVLAHVSRRAAHRYVERFNRRLDHLTDYPSSTEWRDRWERNGLIVDRIEGFLSGRAGGIYNVLAMHLFRFFGLLRGAPRTLQMAIAFGLRMALHRAYLREISSASRPGYVLIVGHRKASDALHPEEGGAE